MPRPIPRTGIGDRSPETEARGIRRQKPGQDRLPAPALAAGCAPSGGPANRVPPHPLALRRRPGVAHGSDEDPLVPHGLGQVAEVADVAAGVWPYGCGTCIISKP